MEDYVSFARVVQQRLGAAALSRIRTAFRNAWINESDFDRIRAAGFNSVRLPVRKRVDKEKGSSAYSGDKEKGSSAYSGGKEKGSSAYSGGKGVRKRGHQPIPSSHPSALFRDLRFCRPADRA